MTAKVFADTNILIYAHDAEAGAKRRRAVEVIRWLWDEGSGRLSTQVLQEFYVNVTRKIAHPVAPALAREIVRSYSSWVETPLTPATVVQAAEIAESYQLSFWDSLIVAAAEQDGAGIVLSEDLNHGQRIASVSIINPFLDHSWPTMTFR